MSDTPVFYLKLLLFIFVTQQHTAKNQSVQHIATFVELCVGVAVQCDRKNELIQEIFSLTPQSQSTLKELVTLSLQRQRETEGEVSFDQESDAISHAAHADDAQSERERERQVAAEEELLR